MGWNEIIPARVLDFIVAATKKLVFSQKTAGVVFGGAELPFRNSVILQQNDDPRVQSGPRASLHRKWSYGAL